MGERSGFKVEPRHAAEMSGSVIDKPLVPSDIVPWWELGVLKRSLLKLDWCGALALKSTMK